MKLKAYKPVLLLMAFFIGCTAGLAQTISIQTKPSLSVSTNFDNNGFELKMDNLAQNLKADLKDLGKHISATVNNITSSIQIEDNENNSGPASGINIDLGDLNLGFSKNDEESGSKGPGVREKNYSKSYPLNGNDKIRLSNQYGKITVNTWDKSQVRVDIEIKAEAGSESDAQRLIDGVQIRDNKNGDQVSFVTDIEHNDDDDEGFWSFFNFGGKNKKHKLNINYVVYMPAQTDLNVESSYGSIFLPSLNGRVRIVASQGSVTAQSLSSNYNEIEGSYCSLKVAAMNGGKLAFSYGSVDVEECNNIRADLSYASFRLGKLNNTADVNLAYGGGFKIRDLSNSFKKLNINTSYSDVSLGISQSSNFDFDIVTSYGSGFKYNDNKVTITAKNPPEGSKHVSMTHSYKGYVGKGNSDSRIAINSSYGGVNFE
ncbi:MAG: hypothetical protein ABI113_19520 [Mucilaginibacter sp.]